MSNDTPCPCCDVERGELDPFAAMALGVTLGSAFSDMHAVTELMCAKHRPRYVMAMVTASIAISTRREEDDDAAGVIR